MPHVALQTCQSLTKTKKIKGHFGQFGTMWHFVDGITTFVSKGLVKDNQKPRLLPDLKLLQNVPQHSLFKLCKFHEKNKWAIFCWSSKYALLCSSIEVIAPSIMPLSIDLHVKCPFYKKWNKKKTPIFFRRKIFTLYLGTTSKPKSRLTGGSVRFRTVSFVLNNDNRPEPGRTAGQPAVGFWSRPLGSK